MTRTAATNSIYPKSGISCSKDSFVIAESFVLRINICGENLQLLVAAKRYPNSVHPFIADLHFITI